MYKKVLLGTAIAALSLTLGATSAMAVEAEADVATVARITGEVVVNKGTQYVSGTEGMGLKTGERVMSLEASSTVIQYKDGCRYTVEANELITIGRFSPCAFTKGSNARLSVSSPLPPVETPAVVVPPVVAPSGAAFPWVPVAAGIGLATIAGVALSGNNDNPPPPLPPISQ